jgi:FkbM family methyltransferase
MPRALSLYQRHVLPRLGADRRYLELASWASDGIELVERTGMHGIRFERDGVWVQDAAGLMWAYEPRLHTTTLGAELGLRYEQAEIAALAARLPAGGVLVDVGANVGLHSIQLAHLVDRLRVLAFEPVNDTFSLLKRNIEKNAVGEQVTARRVAVSDRSGTLRLTNRYQYGNFVVPDGASVAADVAEEVKSMTLDELLSELTDPVDAIKCDVEGAELAVLRGARATIERFHPTILIEIDPRWAERYGNSASDVFGFLTGRGYSYQRFVDDELVPSSGSIDTDVGQSSNFLFSTDV